MRNVFTRLQCLRGKRRFFSHEIFRMEKNIFILKNRRLFIRVSYKNSTLFERTLFVLQSSFHFNKLYWNKWSLSCEILYKKIIYTSFENISLEVKARRVMRFRFSTDFQCSFMNIWSSVNNSVSVVQIFSLLISKILVSLYLLTVEFWKVTLNYIHFVLIIDAGCILRFYILLGHQKLFKNYRYRKQHPIQANLT